MHLRRTARALTAPVALLSTLSLASLALTACSDDSSSASPASPDAPPATATAQTPSSSASQEPALTLRTSTERAKVCVRNDTRDYAWFEVEWRAAEDLDEMAFDLVDSAHVRTIGSGITVPPTNYGGRIDYSGALAWTDRAKVGRNRQVSWPQHDTVWSWTPIEGQTGLLVLHLRFGGEPATIGGVRARWTTTDGRTGTTVVDVPEKWRFADHC